MKEVILVINLVEVSVKPELNDSEQEQAIIAIIRAAMDLAIQYGRERFFERKVAMHVGM